MSKNNHTDKHNPSLPSARKIRRACSRELYRTMKRLKLWIPPEAVVQAEEVYYKKVMLNLLWIHENGSNRSLLSDWFEEHVAPEVSIIWNVEAAVLTTAFRNSFGG